MNKSYYLFSSGELKRKDNSLVVIKEDGEKTNIPIERIYDLYVFSEMSFNTKLFNLLATYGVCVHMFNYYEFYIGSFYPRERHVSGDLLIKQVEFFSNEERRLKLAKEFIYSAAHNIRRNLKYYHSRGKELSDYIERVEEYTLLLDNCKSVEEVMGVEGNIRKAYYASWNTIVNADIDFHKRVKRPPDNMINSLISFLNSMMYTKVLSEIYRTQLNPTISYLHVPTEKRFSLALDIAEIFKPIIVDRVIFTLLNKNMISESDFEKDTNFLKLKDRGMKIVVKEFEDTLKRTIKHRQLGRSVSYQYLIRLELYKLIKHLFGEKEYQGFRIWW